MKYAKVSMSKLRYCKNFTVMQQGNCMNLWMNLKKQNKTWNNIIKIVKNLK